MKPPVDYIFPPVAAGQVPYWRLILRGCSQLAFVTNELTGLFFLAAVFVASPISAAYLLVANTMAPAGRALFGEPKDIVESGLPCLNPGLVALALPAFFHTGWSNVGMWGVLVASIVITILIVSLLLTFVPFPILAVPFLIVFWALSALAPHTDILQPITFIPTEVTTLHPIAAVLRSLGGALFSASVWAGLLFLIGVLLSSWRLGLIALIGAVIGTLVSYYYREVDAGSVNSGLYGFNGVLTAVAIFAICGQLRLAILGALIATILTPAIADLGLLTLSAPFVLTAWLMLALGWIGDTWFDVKPAPASPVAAPHERSGD